MYLRSGYFLIFLDFGELAVNLTDSILFFFQYFFTLGHLMQEELLCPKFVLPVKVGGQPCLCFLLLSILFVKLVLTNLINIFAED